MPGEELTNNRPKNYSSFRRYPNFPSYCFMTDGDFFEQRKWKDKLVTVAYFETIQIPEGCNPLDYPVWDSKKALLDDIGRKMRIPCFVVWHNSKCNVFYVMNWDSQDKIIKMYGDEYKRFIENLEVEKYDG